MRQWVALDRVARPSYLHLFLSLLGGAWGCSSGPAPIAPEGLPALMRATVTEWVEDYVPSHPLRYDLRWTYVTQQGRTRGRAAVRLAPPDSIRFDYRAPFGRSGAAVIIGDDVLWARPEADVEDLIPIAPLFWAALGIPRSPAPGALISGRAEPDQRVWRYTTRERALTYVATAHSSHTLKAEMSYAGRIVGTANVALARETGLPLRASMLFPPTATLFAITVEAIDTVSTVDPAIWKEP